MAFVGDDEIEALDRNGRIVGDDFFAFGAAVALERRLLFIILSQGCAGQRRIDTLDRGDDDLRALIEPGRPELLDVVKLGEGASRPRRPIGEIFVARLTDEIGAVGEKEDAAELSVRKQPVRERRRRKSFSGAGRHLDERARMVLRQRALDAVHGFNLTGAQPLRIERRHRLEATAQGLGFSQPARERLRAMEGEDPAGNRRGIGVVAKQDFARRRDIFEANLSRFANEIARSPSSCNVRPVRRKPTASSLPASLR